MIAVTGASGKLGSAIIENLLKRIPAAEIAVSVRDPSKVGQLNVRGCRVRQADYSDKASLRASLEGAETVLVVSSNTITDGLRFNSNAIEAAAESGAQRIVYTSHMGVNPASLFPPMRTHAASEEKLRNCGTAFVSLRNGFYTDTLLRFLSSALTDGEVRGPEDGAVSWTTHADLAEVAALVLTDPGLVQGFSAPLTASEALNLDDVARLAAEISGKTIKRVVVSEQDFREELSRKKFPELAIEMTLAMSQASRRGEFAAIDPSLQKLLGRPTRSVRDFLKSTIGKT